MAEYVIGDIQGCYGGLMALLEHIEFNPKHDKLFAVGDLVARGEDSLATIKYLANLGNAFSAVLGNHDLHLLAVSQGIRKAKRADNLGPLLNCTEFPDYVDWLRQFPLAQQIASDCFMVHAGLYPKWSSQQLLRYSDEIQQQLMSKDWVSLLTNMYGNGPHHWDESLTGHPRARFIINATTRMRFINPPDHLELTTKCGPNDAEPSLTPWYQCHNAALSNEETVFFGHWAALEGNTNSEQFIALDTGYVWGNALTCIRIEDRARFVVYA